MSRPNWYKKSPARYYPKSNSRWRSRRYVGLWVAMFAAMFSVAEFYTEGAVTWPDRLVRSADGFVRSAYAQFDPAEIGDLPASAVEHRVQRIVDGDTVYLKDGTKVRLHGIDTPERDQPYGKQATRALDRLIGRTVYVVEKDTDRYGRLVGVLYTPEGVNVNEAMVCGGHAWWYSKYARFDSDLRDCQASAQEEGLGLWADDDPMAPWDWRRR